MNHVDRHRRRSWCLSMDVQIRLVRVAGNCPRGPGTVPPLLRRRHEPRRWIWGSRSSAPRAQVASLDDIDGLSGPTFLVGGLVAWGASLRFDISFLLPFAAGNFIYIAASDLVPEVKSGEGARSNVIHFMALLSGIAVLYLLLLLLE